MDDNLWQFEDNVVEYPDLKSKVTDASGNELTVRSRWRRSGAMMASPLRGAARPEPRWCGEWSPVQMMPSLGPEWAAIRRDQAVSASLPCEFAPGHDGPHSWENDE